MKHIKQRVLALGKNFVKKKSVAFVSYNALGVEIKFESHVESCLK